MDKFTSLPLSDNEKARLASVLSYGILDTEKDAELDELTTLTGQIFDVPIVLITILDEKRQWFKSNVGLSITETEKSISFCQYTILGNSILEVENATIDERFMDNPLVLHEPHIRYYCGAPLINEKGFRLGSLALIDRVPRKLNEKEKNTLMLFARLVINYFELHMKKVELEKEKNQLERRVQERTKTINEALQKIKDRDTKLQIINDELSTFIYKISHSLLGPVKTMEGLTNMIIEEAKESQLIAYFNLLRATEKKMDRTLTSLINFLIVRDASETSPILWENIAYASFETAKLQSQKPNGRLFIENSSAREVKANEKLIGLLLQELFTNGLQFNLNAQPMLTLRILDVDKRVVVEVEDNGIGIKEEHRENIYEMFFKSAQSQSDGLGLYIVHKIITKLNAVITLESRKNEGTVFKISIPLND